MMALLCAVVCSVSAQQTTTYTFTSKSWAATPNDWESGKDGNELTSGRGIQVTSGTSGANATSPISFSNISNIVVTYSTNASKGAGNINIQVGTNTAKSFTVNSTGGTKDRTAEFTYNPTESGNVKITVNCTTNSIYIKSITITQASSNQVATPTFSETSGSELAKGTVVNFNCTTSGVTYHYTTDGSNPTTNSPSGSSYTVNSDVTLKVIAVKQGMVNSNVATATYTVAKLSPNLAFSESNVTANIGESFTPPTLSYDTNYDGEITYSSSNSAITVNPNTGEVSYDVSAAGKTTTITATASATANYNAGTASYVLNVVNPNAIEGNLNNSTFGTNYNGQLPEGFTSLTGHIGDVTVIYSRGSNTDTRAYINDNEIRVYKGYELTFEAPAGYYINSLVFNANISSFSCNNGSISGTQWSTSDDLTSVTFTGSERVYLRTVTITLIPAASSVAAPTITPASGTYTEAKTVTITNNAEGATVYYTTNGSTPSASSTAYSGPFTLDKNGTYTIKAIAIDDEGSSHVSTSTITININVPAPTFTEANGTSFNEPYAIHLTAADGCNIYYAINGSPVEDGNLSSSAIAYNASTGIANLSKALTITAVAVDASGNMSSPVTASYTYTGTVQVPYYENFDAGLGNFTVESSGTNAPEWVFRQNTSQADIEKYGEVRKYAYVTGNDDKRGTARLISPMIDLTNVTTATLNFIHAGRYFDGYNIDNQSVEQTAEGEAPTHAQLFVREEGGSWTQLTIPNWFTQNGQYTRFNSGDIDLTSYKGKKIQVSFLYTADSKSTGTWNVLKFAVTGTEVEIVNMKTDGYVTYVVKNDIDWVKTLSNNNSDSDKPLNIHGYKVVEFTKETAVFVEFGVGNNDGAPNDKTYHEAMIPAETPIILKGTAGENPLVIAKHNDVIAKPKGNLLKPSYNDVTATAGQVLLVFQKEAAWTAEDPYNNYAFFKLAAGRTIPDRKAYLNGADVSETLTMSSSPLNSIYLLEDLGKDFTGITEHERNVPAWDPNAPVYDLRGVRMSKGLDRLPKGIYIMGGRKIVVK